jgi:ribosomal protein S18 acetylase RimI-like enzyme
MTPPQTDVGSRPQVEVQTATTADLQPVLDVFLSCWRDSYRGLLPAETITAMSEQRARALWGTALADPTCRTLAAVAEDRVVGVVRFDRQATGAPPFATVHSLYVAPWTRGLGIGRTLLTEAGHRLRAAGAAGARLWVFERNEPAAAFYRRLGWAPDGVTRTQAEFGTPELRLALDLTGTDQPGAVQA